MRRAMMAMAATALLVSACGESEEALSATPEIVVANATDDGADEGTDESTDTVGSGAEDPAAGADDDGAGNAEASDEELALEFADCMRANGFDMADPTVDADGSVSLFDGPPPNGDADAEAAFEVCGEILEGASFVTGILDDPEFEDLLLEMAQCLRDEGIDVDDPDMSAIGPGSGGGGPFGPGFDPDDPQTAAAIDACSGIFAGFGPGGQ